MVCKESRSDTSRFCHGGSNTDDHIAEHKRAQLADDSMIEALPSEDGRYAIGRDNREYLPMQEYAERYSDAYLDTGTGNRKWIAKKQAAGSITAALANTATGYAAAFAFKSSGTAASVPTLTLPGAGPGL
jgi:hypothetical protein